MGTGTGRKRRSRPIKRGEDREEKRWKNTARRAPAGLGLHKAFDAKLGSPQGLAKRRATPPSRQRGASAKPPPRPIPGGHRATDSTPFCRREIFGRRPPADGTGADSHQTQKMSADPPPGRRNKPSPAEHTLQIEKRHLEKTRVYSRAHYASCCPIMQGGGPAL